MTIRNGLKNVVAGKLPSDVWWLDKTVDSVTWGFGGLSDHERLVEALGQRRAGVNR